MLLWFNRFPEFTEFTEFLFHLRKTAMCHNFIQVSQYRYSSGIQKNVWTGKVSTFSCKSNNDSSQRRYKFFLKSHLKHLRLFSLFNLVQLNDGPNRFETEIFMWQYQLSKWTSDIRPVLRHHLRFPSIFFSVDSPPTLTSNWFECDFRSV